MQFINVVQITDRTFFFKFPTNKIDNLYKWANPLESMIYRDHLRRNI